MKDSFDKLKNEMKKTYETKQNEIQIKKEKQRKKRRIVGISSSIFVVLIIVLLVVFSGVGKTDDATNTNVQEDNISGTQENVGNSIEQKDEEVTNGTSDDPLTITNCSDLNEILISNNDDVDKFTSFAEQYKDSVILIDCHVLYTDTYFDDQTGKSLCDVLIGAGDYRGSDKAPDGPNMQLKDENSLVYGSDEYPVGTNIKLLAEIEGYDKDSQLLLLAPMKIEKR